MRLGFVAKRFILGIVLLFLGCAPYGLPRNREKIFRNLLFASPGGHALHLDLYVPKSGSPVPVVVWIFGGSWKIGNKGYHLNLRNLTRYGIAVASIEYRLSGEAKYPAQREDCEAAIDWLRQRGADYGLDASRIGLAGESAGGHLAALVGNVETRSRISAVCALYPPTDLVSLGRMYANLNPSDIERLLGGPIEEKIALAKEASPVEHVSRESPPFLLIHGGNDTLVPLSQSEALDRRLRSAGVESRLKVIPGKGHWFQLSADEIRDVAAFFRRHLGLLPYLGSNAPSGTASRSASE